MEKLYTDVEYTEKSIQANEEGKFLYQYIHDVDYETEVLEWLYEEIEETQPKYNEEGNIVTHKETIINPVYNEDGEITGYNEPTEIEVQETKTVKVKKPVPKMIEEKYIDPETGEEKTRIVQAHHTEILKKEVVSLLIDDEFKYIVFDGNYTRCENNPDYEKEIRAKISQLHMTPLDFIKCLEEKGVSYQTIVGLCNQNAEVDKQLRFCNHVYRGNELLDQLAGGFGISSEELDEMFINRHCEE